MKPFAKISVVILMALFGYIAINGELIPYHTDIFTNFDYWPIACVIILTIIALLLGVRRYKADRKIKHFTIPFAGLIICLFVLIKVLEHKSIDNSKPILRAVNMAGASNVLEFEFKSNDHFRLVEYTRFDRTIFYGNYKWQGDTIQIITSNNDGEIQDFPKSGRIKSDTLFWNNFDTMLIEK